jgi:hypothetical protein
MAISERIDPCYPGEEPDSPKQAHRRSQCKTRKAHTKIDGRTVETLPITTGLTTHPKLREWPAGARPHGVGSGRSAIAGTMIFT